MTTEKYYISVLTRIIKLKCQYKEKYANNTMIEIIRMIEYKK